MTVDVDVSGGPPHHRTWVVGEITITAVTEMTGVGFGSVLLPQATPEAVRQVGWMAPGWHDRGRLALGVHMFIVESGGARLIVDTCVGNDKRRAIPFWDRLRTDFLTRLTAAGFAPHTVDRVISTHLHADHVGWNTSWTGDAWVPTFPAARYLTARDEFVHWATHDDPDRGQIMADSVLPLQDAGLLDLVDISGSRETEVAPGVVLRRTPGHTPGHVSVVLRSGGDTAMISGDVLHHPVQLAHPEWSSAFDTDPVLSARTRRLLLDEVADTRALLLGSAFTDPQGVRLVRSGDGYRPV